MLSLHLNGEGESLGTQLHITLFFKTLLKSHLGWIKVSYKPQIKPIVIFHLSSTVLFAA